jgi:hypothetical protein
MHSTSNLNDGYMGSGKRLWLSINKHGKKNHTKEILEFLDDRESLINREIQLVNEDILNDSMCMNLMKGGKGGFISIDQQKNRSSAGGKRHSELLITDSEYSDRVATNKREGLIRRWKDPEYRSKLMVIVGTNFKNKQHSTETKKLMSASHKNKGLADSNSQFGTCWITNMSENAKIHRGDIVPDGWQLGRIIK